MTIDSFTESPMSAETSKLAYSIAELAQLAGVGRSFIYEEINSGQLKMKKAGRRTLILRADATNWLASLPAVYISSRKRRAR
jgi:excisionase family DNA binding protein